MTDVRGPLPSRDPLRVRPARVAKLIGAPIGETIIADAFARLGFAFVREGEDFVVTPPSFRFDLALEEDYVEEVARMYGYERIPATPAAHVQHMMPSPEAQRSPLDLRRRLAAPLFARARRLPACVAEAR